jgi:hypothetical protein
MPKEEMKIDKPERKFKCCGKEFTKDELYWHKRKCH